MVSESSSVSSNSETLLTCSKFHFEEKVLEKLVRLEHKMEINDQMMKRWEDLFSVKLDKMDTAIKQTEIFVESLRNTDLQEQSRLNDSYHEIVENFRIRSKNETELHRERIKVMLESISSNIEESTKIWEDTFLSKVNKMNKAMNRTETFVESVLRTNLQDQLRLNHSFQKIVENSEIRSKNKTEVYGEKMNTMLESMSSKIEEFSVAEKKRGDALELMQYTLNQEQKRFNQSFDLFMENTKLRSNKTIKELLAQQQKGKTFSDHVVRFSTVTYKIGIDNIETFTSSGKFVCEIPGFYYISAHIRTTSQSFAFYVRKNGIIITRSASDSDSPYSANPISAVIELQLGNTLYANPISAVIELQLGNTLYVFAPSVHIQGMFSCVSIMKVG